MDEQNNNGSEQSQPNPADLFKGLEEKLMSKTAESDKKLADLYASQQRLIDSINSMGNQQQTSKSVGNEDLADLLITNPNEAISRIEARIEKKIKGEMEATSQRNQEDNRVLGELVSEFPELQDGNHELTKSALDIYAKLSDRDKQSPLAYEAAVTKAALKAGILPKSKRKSDSGEFALGGNKGGKGSKETKLDPKTLAFAELMARTTGRDVNDKEYLKSLAGYAAKYQPKE